MRKLIGYIVLFLISFVSATNYIAGQSLLKQQTNLIQLENQHYQTITEKISSSSARLTNLEASMSALATQSAEIKKELSPAK